jgi:hypothetical protein
MIGEEPAGRKALAEADPTPVAKTPRVHCLLFMGIPVEYLHNIVEQSHRFVKKGADAGDMMVASE